MVPKFTSMQDMIGFIRALPKNANYAKMLQEDFGIKAPAGAEAYQKEFLWKYLVQGTHKGIDQAELMKYAVEGVEKLAKTLPAIKWPSENGKKSVPKTKTGVVKVPSTKTSTKGARVGTFDASKGKCTITEKDGKFHGFIGEVFIACSPNRRHVVKRFTLFGREFTE